MNLKSSAVERRNQRFVTPLDFAARRPAWRRRGRRPITALDDVSLAINEREVVLDWSANSGCGKSTLGRIIAGLVSPSAGKVRFHGYTLGAPWAQPGSLFEIQMIFQDPIGFFAQSAHAGARHHWRGPGRSSLRVVGKAEIDGYIDTL